MKSSKKIGKSIVAVVLSIMLMVSVVSPLAVLGSENYGGSKGTSLGQYRYYSVQSGDTMQSIAAKNGITVSDIMTYNGLNAESELYKGQILKIPLTSKNYTTGLTSSTITIKAKDASVKDLVSALAYNAGYTVIFKGQDSNISIDLENVTPLRAIDYITRMVELSYLKDGNTILVSSPSELNTTFVDSLVLSKFTFKYITYDELTAQASALGLSNMKIVSQSNNGRDVWISAYPKEMAKLHELTEILDSEVNVMSGSAASVSNFTPVKMNYISPDEFSSLLDSLGLHSGITMASHPMTLFVFASGSQLTEIMKIKSIVDTYDALNTGSDAGSGNTGTDNSNNGSTDNSGNVADNNNTGDNSNTGDTTTPPGGDSSDVVITAGESTIIKIDLVNISRTDAETIIGLSEHASKIQTYGHSRMLKSIWIMGPTEDVTAVKEQIEAYDLSVVSAASTIHTYEARNCTVAELMNRISYLDIEDGVSFYQYDHPELTSTLICYCDDVTWNNEVYDALVAADTVDTGSNTWIPIASKTSSNPTTAERYIDNTIEFMKELYPETFGNVQFKTATFVTDDPQTDPETGLSTGGTYKVIVYAYTTSDVATRMSNCMSAMNNV